VLPQTSLTNTSPQENSGDDVLRQLVLRVQKHNHTHTCRKTGTSFCLKMPYNSIFEAFKLTENLNGLPPPRPHTHSDPIINKHTEQVKRTMYGCIQLHDTGQNSSIKDHQLCRELEITTEYYKLLEITTDY